MEGLEHKRVVYHQLRSKVESLNRRVKKRISYSRLTWQGLENASINVSIVLMVVYAACIAATLIGKPELRYRIAYFACKMSGMNGRASGSSARTLMLIYIENLITIGLYYGT